MAKSNHRFEVRWRPFQLRPQMPMEGKPKAPNTPSNPRVNPRLKALGQAVGIDFTGACDVYPNTLRAHVLTDLAGQVSHQVQDKVSEALFHAYFTAGDNVNDVDVLVDIGVKAGMDAAVVRSGLEDKATSQRVFREAQEWSRGGIGGVPYFVVNDAIALSGAQDSSAFEKAFARVVQGRA